MATYSSVLSWRIPWTEEPVGLQLQRVRHNLATKPHHIFESWKESKSEVFITRKKIYLCEMINVNQLIVGIVL